MIKILFVCHGNICRSPMAEYVMKDLVSKAGRADEFFIASAATSREELGNGVYPRHGKSLPSTASHVPVTPHGRSRRRIMLTLISSSAWMRRTSGTCGASSPAIRRAKSLSCSTTPGAAGTSPIRGTRAILKRPGVT